jgi:ABC-type multidrug transport system ATPase subunit
MNQEKVITIENLTKMYGNHVGVKDLNLSVNKGEIRVFLAPTAQIRQPQYVLVSH